MTAAAPIGQQITPDSVITADQFRTFMAEEVAAEAFFTEQNNERRTLADYLADLEGRIQRLQDPDDELWAEH